MDFAKKILSKYGWKDGDGLGKNNDGMSKPLKANLKFDNAGFGADQAASDFNNHWWERVFNEAASNVAVKSDQDGVSMRSKNPNEGVEITTKRYSVRKLKERRNDEKYDNFLQSAILTKSGDEIGKPDRIAANEIEVINFKQLTDDELFKACGGRTAHKGARHGLKLSGKLARLEMQEKEMLAKILSKKSNSAEVSDQQVNLGNNPPENNLRKDMENVEGIKKHKKSKRKRKDELTKSESEYTKMPLVEKSLDEEKQGMKMKKKSKRQRGGFVELDMTGSEITKPKKKKSKKKQM